MKTNLILGFLAVSILSGCAKPPSLKRSKKPGSSPTSPIDKGLGDDLKGGTNTDGYTNLKCEEPATHRGIRAWRRLSNAEIIQTAQEVFALEASVDLSQLLNDIPKKEAFDTVLVRENFMEGNRLKAYFSFAEAISSAADLNRIFPCLAEGAGCISAKITEIGALAWRRPLTAEETSAFADLYQGFLSDKATPQEAARFLIQAMVLSPNFLYRSELGKQLPSGEFELDSWEIASALSYLLWRRPPDQQLRDLAKADRLRDSAAIATEAKRLLADPKAKEAMRDFGGMWLDGNRILSTVKMNQQFTDQVKVSMANEVKDFFVHTMFDAKSPTFLQLMTSDYSVADASLGWLYNGAPSAEGTVPFKEEQRRGILGQGGFLASHSFPDQPNPIARGVFIAERLLCIDFLPPPAVQIPEQKPGLSNKERFQQHSSHPACAACHKMIDPLGFATENFDSNGVFRSQDAGQTIVVSQEMMLDGKNTPISSPQGLAGSIAGSQQGLRCFARQAFRFGLGRVEFAPKDLMGGESQHKETVQSNLDKCVLDSVTASMTKNGGELQSALIELVSNPAFRLRLIGKPEQENLLLSGGSH